MSQGGGPRHKEDKKQKNNRRQHPSLQCVLPALMATAHTMILPKSRKRIEMVIGLALVWPQRLGHGPAAFTSAIFKIAFVHYASHLLAPLGSFAISFSISSILSWTVTVPFIVTISVKYLSRATVTMWSVFTSIPAPVL